MNESHLLKKFKMIKVHERFFDVIKRMLKIKFVRYLL